MSEFHSINDWVLMKPEQLVSKGAILLPSNVEEAKSPSLLPQNLAR
jgi:hypothetical protein